MLTAVDVFPTPPLMLYVATTFTAPLLPGRWPARAGAVRRGPGRAVRRCTDRRENRSNMAANFARDESWSSCSRAAISPIAKIVRAEAPSRAIMSVASA